MWHSASLSTLLSLSLALISDANLWSENNKGSWRVLTCRYCGCCRSVYSERDGKWDVFHLHLHPDSIFDYELLTCSSSLLCSWKPALCGVAGRRKKIGAVLLDWWIPVFCGFVFLMDGRGFGCTVSERLLAFSFGFRCFSLETRNHLRRCARVV